MMLQGLMEYAEREKLGDADFEPVGVRWLISLCRNGVMAGSPIALAEKPGEKKSHPKVYLRPFTSPNELNQGTKAHFLCDTLERAALFLDSKTPEKHPVRARQHAHFESLLEEASAECPEESTLLGSVLSFLRNRDELKSLHRQLISIKAKPSDVVLFTVDGNNLLDSEPLKRFWRNRRKRLAAEAGQRHKRICIATGELAETLDTTEKVKGVPGGLATGTTLISFDKDAFCSFGLEQAQNAALCAGAELKIRSALNALIEKSHAQRLVFNNTIHLHWTREAIKNDPFDLLASADETAVAELLKSAKAGQAPIGINANRYYAASLSGNGGRIVVRDWLESTVPEIERHVAEWFEDIGIISPEGSGVKRDFKFFALLCGMVRADLEDISPQLPTQLLHGALRGRSVPLPQAALAAALRRQQLENKLNPARLALIKICLLRSPNLNVANSEKKENIMTECLNPGSRDRAYLCGRLFAVFDRVQYLALGAINAGVVERYYASASVTPALVMGRLFRNAQFHLAKTEGGAASNAGKDFEAITCLLGESFPPTLSLEEQGRFALGYYHQKAEYRRRSAERKEQATGTSK
jgi:CRISPR-associated protein Csd1